MKSIHNSPAIRLRGAAPDAVERLFALAVLLVDGMERGLAERGLTRARAELLWRLHHGGTLTQRALSQALQCTPRNVTGLVDALEGAGLVRRTPHPRDRRATLVELTDEGRRTSATLTNEARAFAAESLSEFEADELACFASVVGRLVDRLQAADAAGNAGEPPAGPTAD